MMSIATIFIAITSIFTLATAQNVYRCGSSYSQQPCPGGTAVPVDDMRSGAQQAQAVDAAARDARLGRRLERERLDEEARVAPAVNATGAARVATGTASPRRTPGKLYKPEVFTAVVPGSKPRKPKARKRTGN